MGLLAGLFASATGGWVFKVITIPLLVVLCLVGFHVCVESWKNNLRAAGAAQCDAKWEARVRADERKVSGKELDTAKRLLVNEQSTTEGLSNELEALRLKYDSVAVGSDSKCLSSSVLDRLGGSGQLHQGGGPVPAGRQISVPEPHPAKPPQSASGTK